MSAFNWVCVFQSLVFFEVTLADTLKNETVRVAIEQSLPLNVIESSNVLYVNPNSNAARQARAWRTSRPEDAALMDDLAAQPTASWYGNENVDDSIRDLISESKGRNAIPVLVSYNIPLRDCDGRYSAGGSKSPSSYISWVKSFVAAIGTNPVIVILEPDALAGIGCLNREDQRARVALISNAVTQLKANPLSKVYIDAGHSGWIDANEIASLLERANVQQADGFALNVSNFESNERTLAYGRQISNKLGGKHFVVDTSRNGNGSNGEWCNPSGRAIGIRPTLKTHSPLVDAFLWVKVPGESDGTCNGGPNAGQWWADYARKLIGNAR